MLLVIAVLIFVVGGAFAHLSDQLIARYPLGLWRMDLDDMLGNVGLFLAGLAAYLSVSRKQKATDAKVNGGLEDLVRDELELSGMSNSYTALLARVEALEGHHE